MLPRAAYGDGTGEKRYTFANVVLLQRLPRQLNK